MNCNNVPRASRPLLVFFLFLLATANTFASSLQNVPADSSVILVATDSGKILAAANEDPLLEKYPPGSLIKVFTAIAYHRDHGDQFPVLQCPRTLSNDSNGCWDRNGHGEVGIVKAIGFSCNVYFRQLAQRTSAQTFLETLRAFELQGNEELPEVQSVMVGSTLKWTVSPMLLLRAYSAMFNGGYLFPFRTHAAKHVSIPESIRKTIYQGMKLSGEKGTSLEATKQSGQIVAGKTGTSLLWQEGRMNWRETQGWWIGLYPAERPKIAVLAFVPHGRGATHAAPLGGKALAQYLRAQ